MKKSEKATVGRREFLRTLGAGATVAAAAAGPLASGAHADTETNDEKRKARYKDRLSGSSDVLPRQPLSGEVRRGPC